MPFDIINLEKRNLERFSDSNTLRKEALPYVGQLRQHKDDEEKVFLRQDPLSPGTNMLEFKKADVLYAEDLKTLSDQKGETVRLIRLWIKKGSVGIRLEPFMVSDFSDVFNQY